jgi:hypothetical protein
MNKGEAGLDTFRLQSTGVPAQGLSYGWEITPATGFTYLNGSGPNTEKIDLIFNTEGFYTVKHICSNFAGSDDTTALNCIEITESSSGIQNAATGAFIPYPNPFTGQLSLPIDQGIRLIEIYNMLGRLVWKGTTAGEDTADLSHLPPGLYYFTAHTDTKTFITQITKQ